VPVKKVREGGRIVGMMVRLVGVPAIARIARQAGLDFIMLDMEHGPHGMQTVEDIAGQARASGIGCFVRVPELARGYVSRALDAGADGVMVPMVSGPAGARELAGWAKYPPVGIRGFGASAGHTDYAPVSDQPRYFAEANRRTLAIAQIELASAIDTIDEIAAVDGIDVLLIGPNDLAISLGVAGQMQSPVLHQAIGKVADAARAHGKIFAMHAPEALLDSWIPRGLTLVMNSLDTAVLQLGMKAIADRYRVR
jgi:4-hydroxy-2-oxoheptanedioate aldolase